MADHDNDIAARLDAAIAGLKSEFRAAQQGLTERVSATNDPTWVVQSTGGSGTHREATDQEAGALKQGLAERGRAFEASSRHIAELEQAVTDLKAEVAQLRNQEAWLVAANQELSERLVGLRTQEKLLAKTTTGADIDELKKGLAEQEEAAKVAAARLAEARRDGEAARRDGEAARGGVGLLSEEIAAVRADNALLQQALEAAQAQAAVRENEQRIALAAMEDNGETRKLGEILLSAGMLTEAQLSEALGQQAASGGRMVGEILVANGHVGECEVAQTVACQLRMPLIHLGDKSVQPEAAGLVGKGLCRQHRCIPVRSTADRLFLAMANPRDTGALEEAARASGRSVVPLVAPSSEVASAIDAIFSDPKEPLEAARA